MAEEDKEQTPQPIPTTTVVSLETHSHDGINTKRIEFSNLNKRKIAINTWIASSDASKTDSYDSFFIVPSPCYLSSYSVMYATASSSGTLTLEKLTSGVALGNGTALLTSTVNLAAGANIYYSGTPIAVIEDLNLSKGDRLAHRIGGTLGNLSNINILVELTLK